MKYKYIIVLFLIIITFSVCDNLNAEVIDEKSFYDLDFDNFVVLKDQNICQEIIIKDLASSKNSKTILQLNIENYIYSSDGLEIDVYLNNLKEKELKNKEIIKKNIIELYNFKKNETNTLKICVDNSFLPKIIFSKKSIVGNYLLAEILQTNFKQIIPSTIESDSLIPIEIIVKNTGFAPINIELDNANSKYLKNVDLENVSGQTQYEGVIDSKDTIKLKYFIKTGLNTKFISPRAVLKYITEFGEKKELKTDLIVINTINKQSKLEAYVDIPREIINNEEIKCKIILKNNSEDNIKEVYIEPNTELYLEFNNKDIIKISKKDIIEVPFTIKSFNTGDYKLSFNYVYDVENDLNKHTLGSELLTINSKNKSNYLSEIIGSLILVFIIIYIWAFKF